MYTVHCGDLGYFSSEDQFGNITYSSIPVVIYSNTQANRIAKKINDLTREEVNVYELKETNGKHYPKKGLTLQDLKKGDIFQYIQNPNSIFAVISDTEVISIGTVNNGNPVGTIYKSYLSMNSSVKKVKP